MARLPRKPLPIKDGLNPSRVAVPSEAGPAQAFDVLCTLIGSQRHRHPDDDEAAILQRFMNGEVVDDAGRPFAATDVIQPGRFVNFYRRPAPERPVPGELKILHQDDDLLVIDKPPFLATLPRGQHIVETALVKARRLFRIPELSPAHRLDRLTRGVLMFTIRPEVRGAYQQLFDRREPTKHYEAVTVLADDAPFAPIPRFSGWRDWPAPRADAPWVLRHQMVKERGRLSTYLIEPEHPFESGVVEGQSAVDPWATPSGANATTRIVSVRRETRDLATIKDPVVRPRGVLVWTLEPLSGKTHQLRLALRTLGLPILNDPLYEELSDAALTDLSASLPSPAFVADEDFALPMQLTAKSLSFVDPFSGDLRTFRSEY